MNLNHIIFTDKFRILLNTLVCSNINFIDFLRALLPLHSIIQILNLSECIFSLLVSLTFKLRCDFILLVCSRCVQFVALHEQTQYKEENYDASCDGSQTALILLRLFGLWLLLTSICSVFQIFTDLLFWCSSTSTVVLVILDLLILDIFFLFHRNLFGTSRWVFLWSSAKHFWYYLNLTKIN